MFIKKVDQPFQSVWCWWADYKKWPGRMASIKKLLERLDQTIDVIDNPKKADKTTDIGTLF